MKEIIKKERNNEVIEKERKMEKKKKYEGS